MYGPLTSLLPRLGARRVLELRPALIGDTVAAMEVQAVCGAASGLFMAVLRQLQSEGSGLGSKPTCCISLAGSQPWTIGRSLMPLCAWRGCFCRQWHQRKMSTAMDPSAARRGSCLSSPFCLTVRPAKHGVSAPVASADGADRRQRWLPHVTAALLAPGESLLRDRVSLYILPGLLRLDNGGLAALLRALLPAPDAVATSGQVCDNARQLGSIADPLFGLACSLLVDESGI